MSVWSQRVRQQALALCREGTMSEREVGLAVGGVPKSTVNEWRRDAGIPPRDEWSRSGVAWTPINEPTRLAEVARRVASGESSKQIATALGTTPRTVDRLRRYLRHHPIATSAAKSPRDWKADALCMGVEDLFDRASAGHPTSVAKAKAICSWCPVRADCIAWAIDTRIDGVLGGTTTSERREMRTA